MQLDQKEITGNFAEFKNDLGRVTGVFNNKTKTYGSILCTLAEFMAHHQVVEEISYGETREYSLKWKPIKNLEMPVAFGFEDLDYRYEVFTGNRVSEYRWEEGETIYYKDEEFILEYN